ncbi:hypothetical protein HDU85_000621 [Gaertneriomyces sp. JEL0708]|nr:hypothetical protein HDU85_000621 [Gaertneriomyces sp. JEL0708]
MHLTPSLFALVTHILPDAHVEIRFPSTDADDGESILASAPRKVAFYDERFRFYLVISPPVSASSPKISAETLLEIVTYGLEFVVTAHYGDDEALYPKHHAQSLPVGTKQPPLAPPPAAHHLGSVPVRARSATTGGLSIQQGRRHTGTVIPASTGPAPPASLGARTVSLIEGPSHAKSATDWTEEPRNQSLPAEESEKAPMKRTKQVFFSHTYTPDTADELSKPIILEKACLVPFEIPLRVDASIPKESHLNVSVKVIARTGTESKPGQELCNADDYDAPNILAPLADDAYMASNVTAPSYILSQQSRKMSLVSPPYSRTSRKSIPVTAPLNVSTCLAVAGDSLMLSLALENGIDYDGSEVQVNDIKLSVSGGNFSRITGKAALDYPVQIRYNEEVRFAYVLTLIDLPLVNPTQALSNVANTSNATPGLYPAVSKGSIALQTHRRLLTIRINGNSNMPGIHGQDLSMVWSTVLDFTWEMPKVNIVPTYGLLPDVTHEPQHGEGNARTPDKGLLITFNIEENVVVKKIFSVRCLLCNRGSRNLELRLVVPNGASPAHSAAFGESSTSNDRVKHDLLDAFKARDLALPVLECLEKTVDLRTLAPNTVQSASLHFVGTKEGLHSIPLVQVIDRETGAVLECTDVGRIWIQGKA